MMLTARFARATTPLRSAKVAGKSAESEDETHLSGVMLDAMPPANCARRWRKVSGQERKQGRDAPHIAPETALGREASPGQSTGINREHGHFPTAPLRFDGSKTVRPH
jgi:hypothetical protein